MLLLLAIFSFFPVHLFIHVKQTRSVTYLHILLSFCCPSTTLLGFVVLFLNFCLDFLINIIDYFEIITYFVCIERVTRLQTIGYDMANDWWQHLLMKHLVYGIDATMLGAKYSIIISFWWLLLFLFVLKLFTVSGMMIWLEGAIIIWIISHRIFTFILRRRKLQQILKNSPMSMNENIKQQQSYLGKYNEI